MAHSSETQIETRMCLFRGGFKGAAVSKIVAHYGLITRSRSEATARVDALLEKKRYIYPGLIQVRQCLLPKQHS